MPSTYTIRYATPLCFARTMVRNGQHGVHFTCFRPLRYRAPTNEWECGGCGELVAGELVAVRRSTGERDHETRVAPPERGQRDTQGGERAPT